MSAFVVSKTHIDSIVTYAADRDWSVYAKGRRYDLKENDDRKRLGQLLVDANYASVNYRYRENDKAPKYRFTPIRSISAVQMLKALYCLDYQSCELPNWEQTEARMAILSLMSSTVSDLPGYEEARWELPEQAESTKLRLMLVGK